MGSFNRQTIALLLVFAGPAFVLGCQSEVAIPTNLSPSSTPTLNLIGSSPSPTSTSTGHSISLSWTANKEADVNALGGGYRVYYSTTSGFSLSGAQYVNVPYVSGTSSPTSATIPNVQPSTLYYIQVAAFSPYGMSSPAPQVSVTTP